MTVARRLVFPLCLLVGPLLVIVAGTLHPDLAGDGAAQLAAIAQCSAWRAIHWTFLFSFPLALTGLVGLARVHAGNAGERDRKSTRLNSSHSQISYAVFCLKKKKTAGWT